MSQCLKDDNLPESLLPLWEIARGFWTIGGVHYNWFRLGELAVTEDGFPQFKAEAVDPDTPGGPTRFTLFLHERMENLTPRWVEAFESGDSSYKAHNHFMQNPKIARWFRDALGVEELTEDIEFGVPVLAYVLSRGRNLRNQAVFENILRILPHKRNEAQNRIVATMMEPLPGVPQS